MASRPSPHPSPLASGPVVNSARKRAAHATIKANPSMPVMMVGIAVVAVVATWLLLSRNPAAEPQNTATPASAPAKQPTVTPAPSTLQMSSAKQGKSPTTPPPPLTQATLQELSSLLDKVKALRNEAVTARTGSSDIAKAKAKMAEAHQLLQQWEKIASDPLRWQEMAQMEDWAQPAEYVTLEKLFATFGRLNNEVRKGGGGG